MRAVFGLAGLLVVVGVIVMLMAMHHPADAVREGEKVKDEARQIAGYDKESGRPASETAEFTLFPANKTPIGMMVERVADGGALQVFFGLQPDDVVVAAGPLDFKGEDLRTMKDFLLRAYQSKGDITVLRGENKLSLPRDRAIGAKGAPTAPPTGSTPTPPAAQTPPKDNTNSVRRQLDAITAPR